MQKSNWFEEVFVIKKVKNILPWTCFVNDFIDDEIVEMFYKKELIKTTDQKGFRVEKGNKKKRR